MKIQTTVGNGRDFITQQQLAVLGSIMQDKPAPTTSDKYKFYSTYDMVKGLAAHDWHPVKAQEQRLVGKNIEQRTGFQKHLVRFRQREISLAVGDLFPELVLTNSHNGSATFILMAGFFRLACLNGMVVSEGSFGQINVRHLGHEQDEVIEASYKILDETPRLIDNVKCYQAIELKPMEQEIFAVSALSMKYAGDSSKMVADGNMLHIDDRTFNVSQLLEPRRTEDSAKTLWNTFNTVQEKMTKGNRFEATVHRTPKGFLLHKTKVPEIKGINEGLRVNRGLWHLMEQMAIEKQKQA